MVLVMKSDIKTCKECKGSGEIYNSLCYYGCWGNTCYHIGWETCGYCSGKGFIKNKKVKK